MNGYVCFWNRQRVEIEAETTYKARQKVTPIFQRIAGRRRVRDGDVTVVLAEKDGKPVVHAPTL